MYGITSFHEQRLPLSVSHVLIKKRLFAYTFVTKCNVILCLGGIISFIYATWVFVSKYYVLHHVFAGSTFSFKSFTCFD